MTTEKKSEAKVEGELSEESLENVSGGALPATTGTRRKKLTGGDDDDLDDLEVER